MQVEFGGGTLDNETGNAGDNTAPDPTVPNTNFDLVKIPKAVTFNTTKLAIVYKILVLHNNILAMQSEI